MEPANKVDIKSEIYLAAMPHISVTTKQVWARYRQLPSGEVFRYFAILYVAAGFIVSSIAGALPAMIMSFFHMSSIIFDVAFIFFWPVIAWFIGSKDQVIISLAAIFCASVYISHLRQHAIASVATLAGAQARIAALETQPSQMIDITPTAVLAAPIARPTA
jgi:hypothetical protein